MMKTKRSIGWMLIFLMITSCDLLGIGGEPDIPGKIVFSARDGNNTNQIYTMNADGSGVRQLTYLEDGGALGPLWSPDRSRIVFVSNRDSSERTGSDLYITEIDGDQIERLTETGKAGRPVWHPDGKALFYWFDNNLYEIDIQNKETKRRSVSISGGKGFRPVAISPSGDYLLLHTFSYVNTREDQSLQVLDLSSQELTHIYSNASIHRADWR